MVRLFWVFFSLADKLRPEVHQAVDKAHRAGIEVVMITGDNSLTAQTIGKEAGIIQKNEDILEGSDLDHYTDEELLKILPKVRIFARTTPEHKHRLVRLYQKLGHVVTVTGDGVNDSLALKQADVGVAMGGKGTDVAKETADIILTDDNFATLINAIEEGRNIFINIKKAIKYLLSTNLAEVLVVITTLFLTQSIALTALQILYINLISDGVPALALAFTPSSSEVMSRPALKKNNLVNKNDLFFIFLIGAFANLLTLMGFLIGSTSHDIRTARSLSFSVLIFIQPLVALHLWSVRQSLSESLSLLRRPLFAMAFFLPFALQPIILYSKTINDLFEIKPLGGGFFLIAILLASLVFLPFEVRKIQKYVASL